MENKQKAKPKRVVIAMIAVVAIGTAVKSTFFQGPFRYAGTLESTKVDLTAQVASQIAEIGVREGDHVQENQSLLKLKCEDIHVADELATINYNRTLKLFRSGTAPQETLDTVMNRKKDADVKLGWCQINAPLHATVLDRYHEPGEWVNIGTKLLTLANIRDIWAYIYVAQPDVFRLKPGMKVTGFLPELRDRTFEGTILKINAEAEFTPKNVQTRSERERLVYGVKVSFMGANEQEILKPGMTIEIELPRARENDGH